MGAHFEEGLKSFPGSDKVPVEIFLLINCFFDATLTSIWVFLEGQSNFRYSFIFFPSL